jgi:hypothetical protein
LDQFRADLLSRADDTKNINVWELKDLGYQAAQRILRASDALQLMREMAQVILPLKDCGALRH